MREIKFRGKRISDGEWVLGNLVSEVDGNLAVKRTFIHLRLSPVEFSQDSLTSRACFHEVDPKTVGQYTGLHDKNGEEIFEGDQLFATGNLSEDEGLEYVGDVVWDEEDARFEVENFHGRFEFIPNGCMVSGNIYESEETQ